MIRNCRKLSLMLSAAALIFFIWGCQENTQNKKENKVKAPIAKKVKKELTKHGHTRIDEYFWMKQRDDSAVLAYLNAENEYTNAVMRHTEEFQKKLYDEIIGRIKKTDESVPYLKNGYYYYSRTEGEAEYPLVCRKKGTLEANEEILLNIPEMAKGFSFYDIGTSKVSPNNKLLAFSEDTVSRRLYNLKFKNLETGEIYPESIPNTSGSIAWANDNKTIFYVVKDLQTLLPYRVYKHTLGTDAKEDKLVYEEKDNTFYTFCYTTKSQKYIVIGVSSTMTSEFRYLDADNPTDLKVFAPRERGVEYSIAHYGDNFYIRTNWNAKNFKLMKTPVTKTGKENWKDVIAHRENVLLEDFDIFKNYLVVSERKEGLSQLRIIKWADMSEYYIDFGEPAYVAGTSVNYEYDTKILRYNYTSLTTPYSTYDYNMETKEKTLLKQQEVLGDFKPENYKSERVFVTAKDGAKIPVSLVYKKGLKKDGNNPLFIQAYGSYGHSSEPYFSSVRLTLLNRGFVYAIAHVRGGQEMGRQWYEDGKLLKKINTFTDFNSCTEYLINEKYTNAGKTFAWGGSAGGLLMGAIANMKPELYKGIIAAVPFVDVVTTMLDESIPLTTGEYDEWGNPNEKEYYDYMLSYSPYDNVKAQNYPAMLVTTGYHDSQVQYWEPAKWVAKLRDMKTDDNMLIFKINMDYGHGGASGRFQRYKELALEYAFVLNLLGITQ